MSQTDELLRAHGVRRVVSTSSTNPLLPAKKVAVVACPHGGSAFFDLEADVQRSIARDHGPPVHTS